MEKDKKKLLLMFIALAVAMIGLGVYMVLTQFGGKDSPKQETSVTAPLPDGEVQRMTASKSEAFRGTVSTDAYFDMLGDVQPDQEEEVSLVSDSLKAKRTPVRPTTMKSSETPVERLFGKPAEERRPEPAVTNSGASSVTRSGGGGASRPMTQEEKLEFDRKRAEMVRDVLTGAHEETPVTEDAPEKPASIDLSAVCSSDGIISSLDDDFDDAAVQYEGAKRPFRCMFVRDQKLTSGQRVTLRLLEDYNLDGVRIPANTHLAAICKIGERLELQVRSFEINGRIIPLALDAYDTDGLQGIYCPETSASKNSRKASDDAISTAGQTFGGLVGDIASTVIRTGASIAKSASGEVSVSVVSGYEFYLVKSERR